MKKLPWYFKLAYFFCLPAALLAALVGCAELAQPVKGTCAFLHLGDNEGGVAFFKYECRPDEK